jgi:AraC-like DNA-binding protein
MNNNKESNEFSLEEIKLRTAKVFRMGARLTCGFSYIPLKKERRILDVVDQDYTVVYVIKGNGKYIDSQGRETPITAGTVFQRFPGTRHSVVFYPNEDIFEAFMVVPKEICEILIACKTVSTDKPLFSLGLYRDIIERFEAMLVELREQPNNKLSITIARMHAFICDLLLMKFKNNNEQENIMARACYILEEKLNEKISIPDIAKRLNMSNSNFRRLFCEYAGEPPGEYRIKRRIEKIEEKLISGTESINEIAMGMGYPDIYSFSKQFKKYTGQSPRLFQQKNSYKKI